MYIYQPPEKWTEALIRNISGEDNRYEFKEWGRDWANPDKYKDKVESLISAEVCALANSFGGTLFFGVQDKTKKITGIPRNPRGNANAESWIENLIPNWLEFRLPDFRVLEVELTEDTKKLIGTDKTVISIDIYDSDLAPHSLKGGNKYYYRQNSKSEPAPHHYLAYLWGRSNSNMGHVVLTWFKGYLNPLINVLEKFARDFESKSFDGSTHLAEGTLYMKRTIFFDLASWSGSHKTLTAKQFLRTFPVIKDRLDAFTVLAGKFLEEVEDLEDVLLSSRELQKAFQYMLTQEFFEDEFRGLDTSKPIENLAHNIRENSRSDQFKNLLLHPKDFKRHLAQNTTYLLMNLDPSCKGNPLAFELAKKYIITTFNKPLEAVEKISKLRIEISEKALSLANEIDELRHNLSLRHVTTYE
jgi:hypothetical protein